MVPPAKSTDLPRPRQGEVKEYVVAKGDNLAPLPARTVYRSRR
jgi:hypothetical protein